MMPRAVSQRSMAQVPAQLPIQASAEQTKIAVTKCYPQRLPISEAKPRLGAPAAP